MMADENTKAMSWPMIIGIVFLTNVVLIITVRIIASMLGLPGAVGAAGAGGAGVVAAILISRRRAALARGPVG
jgi:hypothetical protein